MRSVYHNIAFPYSQIASGISHVPDSVVPVRRRQVVSNSCFQSSEGSAVVRCRYWRMPPEAKEYGKIRYMEDGKKYGVAFARLAKSKFRSRFRLSPSDRKYIADKGLTTIRLHCEDFIRTRIAPANPPGDGRQTPMRGHPVFKAQHACACCCRGCLCKWWKVPRGIEIPAERQSRIVDFLMAWIERQLAS